MGNFQVADQQLDFQAVDYRYGEVIESKVGSFSGICQLSVVGVVESIISRVEVTHSGTQFETPILAEAERVAICYSCSEQWTPAVLVAVSVPFQVIPRHGCVYAAEVTVSRL